MAYNMTFMETATTFYTVTEGINNSLGGVVGALILLMLALVVYVVMKQHDTKTVLLAVSFLTSTVSIMFFIIGFIGIEIAIVPWILLLVSVFYAAASQ